MTSHTRLTTADFDYQPERWMDEAVCIGHPTEWWFPTHDGVGGGAPTEETAAAKAICGGCPVQTQCLDYALRVESGFQRYDIYGGLSPDARRKLDKATS